jgi:flagellar motor switch/type III secretory pathway protein FliN
LTHPALEWLPLSALADVRAVEPAWVAIEQWSDLWFAVEPCNRGKVNVQAAEQNVTPSNVDWRSFGHECRFAWNQTIALAWAKSALSVPLGQLDLQAVDLDLLLQFATEMMRDLSAKLAKSLRLVEVPADAELASNPFDAHGGLILHIRGHQGLVKLQLALPAQALVPYRKAAIGSEADLRQSDETLMSALRDESLDFTAVLGLVRIKASDFVALDEGDVIILDSGLDDLIYLNSRKSGRRFASARVAQNNGQIELLAAAA